MPEDYESDQKAQEEEAEAEKIKQREINAKRKKLLAAGVFSVVGALTLLGILLLILSAVDSCTKERAKSELEKSMTRRYNYVDPDYDFDILGDEGYLSKDRNVWVSEGIVKTVITEDNRSNYSPEIQFMYDLVNIIIKGEYIEYNKLFSAEYFENAKEEDLRERFTMQQLFQIEIGYLDRWEAGGISYSDMSLIYRIRNNNGTFRNDLDYNDDGYIPVVYRLTTDKNGATKIRNLMTQSRYISGLYD
ncbi:MAG: hypothetical protein FWG34_05695 [Oscillospiraceae bacterium]|nr:hypothetical protein [Oscillospiraceae bacterium]